MGLGGAALLIAGSVLLSRILGVFRETLLAALLGLTVEADQYRYAFVIPDLLNYLLAAGFLSITLIPLLSERIAQGDRLQLHRDVSRILVWVGGGIVLLTGLLWVLAPTLCQLAFPTLDGEQVTEVTRLTRIVLPAQVAFVVGALLMAYQYAGRHFLFPALAPIVYNLGIIVGGVIGGSAEGFAWGALVGAVAGTLALQWVGARRAGFSFAWGGSRALATYLGLAFPLMVGQSITVLDEQFPRIFSQLGADGSAAALSLARMLNMLPVGLIAQAAAVASFPFLASLVAQGQEARADRLTLRALRGATFASMAALALVAGAAVPLVRLVYQWGAFESADTNLVAALLTWFALAIPAWGIHQVLGRWFYAHRRMWLPVVIGTIATVVAIPLTLGAFDRFGVDGIAVASSIAMWLYTIALAVAWGRAHPERWRPLLTSITRLLPLTILAAVMVRLFVGAIDPPGVVGALFQLLAAAVIISSVFAIGGLSLRLEESRPGWWRRSASEEGPDLDAPV